MNCIVAERKVSTIFIATGNTDIEDSAHQFHGQFAMMFFKDERIALMSSYFFRRCAKKPSASFRTQTDQQDFSLQRL